MVLALRLDLAAHIVHFYSPPWDLIVKLRDQAKNKYLLTSASVAKEEMVQVEGMEGRYNEMLAYNKHGKQAHYLQHQKL